MGMWRGGKEQEGQLQREREMGEIKGRWVESGKRNRSLESGQRWSGKSGETKGVEEQRPAEERMMKCSRAGKVVRWSERTEGV